MFSCEVAIYRDRANLVIEDVLNRGISNLSYQINDGKLFIYQTDLGESKLVLSTSVSNVVDETKRTVQDLREYLRNLWLEISEFEGDSTNIILDQLNSSSQDAHFSYVQNTATTPWVINHNLGKEPSVLLTDLNGNRVHADVKINNENTLTVSFDNPFAGKAHLN